AGGRTEWRASDLRLFPLVAARLRDPTGLRDAADRRGLNDVGALGIFDRLRAAACATTARRVVDGRAALAFEGAMHAGPHRRALLVGEHAVEPGIGALQRAGKHLLLGRHATLARRL